LGHLHSRSRSFVVVVVVFLLFFRCFPSLCHFFLSSCTVVYLVSKRRIEYKKKTYQGPRDVDVSWAFFDRIPFVAVVVIPVVYFVKKKKKKKNQLTYALRKFQRLHFAAKFLSTQPLYVSAASIIRFKLQVVTLKYTVGKKLPKLGSQVTYLKPYRDLLK
jgi:hypothetical protein